MRLLSLLAGAALGVYGSALQPAPQPAPAAQQASPTPTAVLDTAMRLARLIYPPEKVLAIQLKAYDVAARRSLDPQQAALFAKYPGLLDAVVAAGRTVTEKHIVALAPDRQRRFADFYAAHFSPAEIDELIEFYSSPVGGKLIDGLYTRTNVDKLIGPRVMQGELNAKEKDDLKRAAAAQAYAQFSADDRRALNAFVASPVHAKLGKLSGEFDKLLASLDQDPTLDMELDKAVETTVTKYMTKSGGH
jgi:hypothetical protein